MAAHRRWFQFSLRTFFVVLTALAVWLGVIVNRQREQCEAVKAIEATGAIVQYDWEPKFGPEWATGRPRGGLVDELLQKVVGVLFDPGETSVRRLIPSLKRLPALRSVYINGPKDGDVIALLKSELPQCEVLRP